MQYSLTITKYYFNYTSRDQTPYIDVTRGDEYSGDDEARAGTTRLLLITY